MSLMDQLARMMDVALAKHSAVTEAQVRRIERDSAAQSTVVPQAPAPCPLPPSSFPPHCPSQASAMSQHSAHDDDVVRKALGITADSLKLLTAVNDSRRDEVTTSITSSLAARGRDVVLWRVAEGLIFNKFVEDRFKIFSIPHLVAADGGHNRNSVSLFESLLATAKHEYGGNSVRAPQRPAPGDRRSVAGIDGTHEGIRCQRSIAERRVSSLLRQLDVAEQLPKSKPEWMLYVDAGADLMACYATAAVGFPSGGARIYGQYNAAVTNGYVDWARLWNAKSFQDAH
jgi:hypothetical protein